MARPSARDPAPSDQSTPPPTQARSANTSRLRQGDGAQASPEQIEQLRILDDERTIGALGPLEQIVEPARVRIDDEQARIGGLQPAKAEVHRPQIGTIVVLDQRLREDAGRERI